MGYHEISEDSQKFPFISFLFYHCSIFKCVVFPSIMVYYQASSKLVSISAQGLAAPVGPGS